MAETDRLVWMDMEMTGLEPEQGARILELAVLVTDGELHVLAEGPSLVLRQPETVLAAMDDWNQRHHGESGLLARVRASAVDEQAAEEAVLDFVRAHVPERAAPLAGNSIHQDRRFLRKYMPRLDAHLHYRNVDVSTVKELVRRWYPTVLDAAPKKAGHHRALDDIRESIAELAHYREYAFRRV